MSHDQSWTELGREGQGILAPARSQNKCSEDLSNVLCPSRNLKAMFQQEKAPRRCLSWDLCGDLIRVTHLWPKVHPGWQLTFVQGGMVMFKWQRMCWVSSYFIALRRNDKNPPGSRLLSLT